MKVCSKCNSKINHKSLLKSLFNNYGLIECNLCKTNFKMKYNKIFFISTIIFNFFILLYLRTCISNTFINIVLSIVLILVIDIILNFTALLFLPYKEV